MFFFLLSFLVVREIAWFQEWITDTFLTKILLGKWHRFYFSEGVNMCDLGFYPLAFLSLSAEYRIRGQKSLILYIFLEVMIVISGKTSFSFCLK